MFRITTSDTTDEKYVKWLSDITAFLECFHVDYVVIGESLKFYLYEF